MARSLAPDLPVVAVVLTSPIVSPTSNWRVPVPRILPRSIAERITHMNFAQAFDIFMRSVEIGNRAVAEYRLQVEKPDVIVRPAVSRIELLGHVDVREAARLGEEAVEAVLPELKNMVAWPRRLGRKLFGGRK